MRRTFGGEAKILLLEGEFVASGTCSLTVDAPGPPRPTGWNGTLSVDKPLELGNTYLLQLLGGGQGQILIAREITGFRAGQWRVTYQFKGTGSPPPLP